MPLDQLTTRSVLLKLFAGHQLLAVTDDIIAKAFSGNPTLTQAEVQLKMEELSRDRFYLGIKQELKSLKEQIERTMNDHGGQLSPEEEVKIILFEVVLDRAISFTAGNAADQYQYKMKLLYDLLEQTYIAAGQWDQRLAKHFQYVYPILQDWYSFFFSYTNREAFDINKRYEAILPLGQISSQSNQVARLVASQLCKEFLPHSFIDEKEIEYGTSFKEVIDKAIKTSYTFVQIVSNESFYKIGNTNWCQYELESYNQFLSDNRTASNHYYEHALKDNVFFVVMGQDLESVKPVFLLSEYKQWLQQIKSTHYLKFEPTNNYSSFKDTIRNLAKAIIQAKKRLIDAVPVEF